MAKMSFVLNELQDHDPILAARFENEIRQATQHLEPGERLNCFIFLDPGSEPGAELLRLRVEQRGWGRDFPPVSLDTPPVGVGLTMTRSLRREARPRGQA